MDLVSGSFGGRRCGRLLYQFFEVLGFDFLKADRDGGLSKTEGAELLDAVEVAAWFGGPAVGVADVGFGAIEAVEVYAPGGVGGGFFFHGRNLVERDFDFDRPGFVLIRFVVDGSIDVDGDFETFEIPGASAVDLFLARAFAAAQALFEVGIKDGAEGADLEFDVFTGGAFGSDEDFEDFFVPEAVVAFFEGAPDMSVGQDGADVEIGAGPEGFDAGVERRGVAHGG